jgi:hypothetical protein
MIPLSDNDALPQTALKELHANGFAILPSIFRPEEINELTVSLIEALGRASESVLERQGVVYAARNLLRIWPQAATVWRRQPLFDLLQEVLGRQFGLVRVLYFDKPPEATWSLPWHKDLTIAVQNNRLPTSHFRNPTTKAGVPHVEAHQELLENMVTARIHLDDMTMHNGPIRVMPGSHSGGKAVYYDELKSRTIMVNRGDVLLIRPLVAHCSLPSPANAQHHRRILHLEFAGTPDLPESYKWHDYLRGQELT